MDHFLLMQIGELSLRMWLSLAAASDLRLFLARGSVAGSILHCPVGSRNLSQSWATIPQYQQRFTESAEETPRTQSSPGKNPFPAQTNPADCID
jgi:hypothetical protein